MSRYFLFVSVTNVISMSRYVCKLLSFAHTANTTVFPPFRMQHACTLVLENNLNDHRIRSERDKRMWSEGGALCLCREPLLQKEAHLVRAHAVATVEDVTIRCEGCSICSGVHARVRGGIANPSSILDAGGTLLRVHGTPHLCSNTSSSSFSSYPFTSSSAVTSFCAFVFVFRLFLHDRVVGLWN